MRLAIVSDVHGNLTALEAVIADLERRGVDRVVHGGDLALMGCQGAEVVDRIRELGWPGIVGNTDEVLWRPELHDELAADAPGIVPVLDMVFRQYGPASARGAGRGADRVAARVAGRVARRRGCLGPREPYGPVARARPRRRGLRARLDVRAAGGSADHLRPHPPPLHPRARRPDRRQQRQRRRRRSTATRGRRTCWSTTACRSSCASSTTSSARPPRFWRPRIRTPTRIAAIRRQARFLPVA